MRVVSVALTDRVSENAWFGIPSSDYPPKHDLVTGTYEDLVTGLGPRERFWVFFDDPNHEEPYYHLNWDDPRSRSYFEVLAECLWRQVPVRVSYYTADGEVIRAEAMTP